MERIKNNGAISLEKLKHNGVFYYLDFDNKKVLDLKQQRLSKAYFDSIGLSEQELYSVLEETHRRLSATTYLNAASFNAIITENLHSEKVALSSHFDELIKGINYKIIKSTHNAEIYQLLCKIAEQHGFQFILKKIPLLPSDKKMSSTIKRIKKLYPNLVYESDHILCPKILMPVISNLLLSST